MYPALIAKIRNAQAVGKDSVKAPHTKMDEAVLEVLKKHGYIDSFETKGRSPKRTLEIKLKYADGKGAIGGVRLLSTPSRHLYFGTKRIFPVKNGYGTLVISTPKGIIDGEGARRNKIGGEALFQIW